MNSPKGFPEALPHQERLAMAKARTDRVVDHVSTLFTLNEANRHVIYSDKLAKQIPRSHAASAFLQFQMSMHLFELIRLCALWDKPARDRESIPTILELINDPAIVDQVVAETRRFYAEELSPSHLSPFQNEEHQKAYEDWWSEERVRRGEEEADRARNWINDARQLAEEIQAAPQLAAMRDFRDRYIAHNLTIKEPAPGEPSDVVPLKYGYEAYVLDATVRIADWLHLFLNGTSFDWDGSRKLAADNASSLWEACRFDKISY